MQRFETSKHVVLAFELMEGGDLHDHLLSRGRKAEQSALSESDAKIVFAQIVSGLSYAHMNNVVHRDLKLENIL
jgi:serine/threonine protein kinase